MVDAPSGISGILGDLSKYSFRLDRIILTHGHFDHVLGIAEALKVFPAAELMQEEMTARYQVRRVGPCEGVEEHCFALAAHKKLLHPLVQKLLAAARPRHA